jgi:hypothetical protein
MYLIHNTDINYLLNILNDGWLKSNKITKNINDGAGIYKDGKLNDFVYFSTTPNLFDKYTSCSVVLYLSSDILYAKSFYVSFYQTPLVNNIHTNNQKYKKNTKNYNYILQKLYEHSTKTLKKGMESYAFIALQQVAIKNKINIKNYIVGIEFKNEKPSNEILNIIKNKYPNTQIKKK